MIRKPNTDCIRRATSGENSSQSIHDRKAENYSIKSIKKAAMPRQNLGAVLSTIDPLQEALAEISDLGHCSDEQRHQWNGEPSQGPEEQDFVNPRQKDTSQ